MPAPSIHNLRRGIIAGGASLLVLLVAVYAMAHLRGRLFHLDLPGRLGVNISQTANGFTYSQSQKGHTLFTIHASKLVQYKADQAELHDVTITLYGPEGSGRTDKIYGSDFLYDRKAGLVRATGAVQIDFAAPAPASGNGTGTPGTQAAAQANPVGSIHVTTSGVTFSQASGEASTEQRVDFALTRAAGSAIGANFNSKTGVLVLDREVALTTTGEPGAGAADVLVHAAHAQLLREAHQAYLIQADTTYNGARTTSDQATVSFRQDGSAEHIDARGHVHMTTEDGAEVHTSTAAIDLDPQSQPLLADLGGGVTYNSVTTGERMQGSAVSGTLNFVSQAAAAPNLHTAHSAGPEEPGRRVQALHHAQFRDAVTFVIQRGNYAGDANGSSTRELRGSRLDVDFAPGADGKAEAQHALVVGGAAVKLHDIPAKGPAKTTTISGDQLLAVLAGGHELRTLDGKGSTSIVDTAPDGTTSTSTGDTLHLAFLAVTSASPAARGAKSAGATEIDSAVQTGNVAMTQTPAPSARNSDGSPQASVHATAARAEYGGADQLLHLTGDPHLRNDTFALSADQVDYHRGSGDATARGNVKSTYLEPPASPQQPGRAGAPTLGGDGPVHIIADHAQMTRATNLSIFYGSATGAARMWQGADAVAAPVLELSRTGQTLDAHGAAGDRGGAVVHATLGARPPKPGAAPAGGTAGTLPGNSGPARLSAVTLRYSDKDRRADLHGSVVAEQPSGVIHADEGQVFLTPSVQGQSSAVDHMVATGHVVIMQPGRRGTGERLVYTAADGRYLLTGSPAQPPRVTDAMKGTSTGAALIFRSPDGSVEVSDHAGASGPAGNPPSHAVRTVTDTHSPK